MPINETPNALVGLATQLIGGLLLFASYPEGRAILINSVQYLSDHYTDFMAVCEQMCYESSNMPDTFVFQHGKKPESSDEYVSAHILRIFR